MKASLQPKRRRVIHHNRLAAIFRPLPVIIVFLAAVIAMPWLYTAQAGGEKSIPIKHAQPGIKVKIDQIYNLAGFNVRSYVEVDGKIYETGVAWDECEMKNPIVDGERVYLPADKVQPEEKQKGQKPFFYLDSLVCNGKPAAGKTLALKARGAKLYTYDLVNSSQEIGPVNVATITIPLDAINHNGCHRIELTPAVGNTQKTIITYRHQWTLVQPWER